LKNVIVFSQKGDIPPPMTMSGSDLDGDIYWITWNNQLISIFPEENEKPLLLPIPMFLESSNKKVDVDDQKKFFIEYIKNDCLGKVANAHLAHADTQPMKARDPLCLKLAMLHSFAVDYPKTGVPAKLESYSLKEPKLIPQRYPDFMGKPPKRSFPSQSALGEIYRKFNQSELKEIFQPNQTHQFSQNIESFITENHQSKTLQDKLINYSQKIMSVNEENKSNQDEYQQIEKVIQTYQEEMESIRNQFGVNTEIELALHTILFCLPIFGVTPFDSKQKIITQVNILNWKCRGIFFRKFSNNMNANNLEIGYQFAPKSFKITEEMKDQAALWYSVYLDKICKNTNSILGFPFIIYDILCCV